MIVNDTLSDVSYALLEPVVNTTLGSAVSGAGTFKVIPGSLTGIYVGAQLIVGSGATQEIITVSAIAVPYITATFANAHASTDALYGATFPAGQPNFFLYTQDEMTQYVADAQKDFLLRTRCRVEVSDVTITVGGKVSTTLGTAVTGSGQAVVQPPSMTNITVGTWLLIDSGTNQEGVLVVAITGTTFTAVFSLAHAATATVQDSPRFYPQSATTIRLERLGLSGLDLLDCSMADLDLMQWNNTAMQSWQADTGTPTNWFQDEAGTGNFGLYPLPNANGTVECWASDRGADSLVLTDTLVVPDLFTPAIKWYVLMRAFEKDGEQRDPQRAKMCLEMYKMWVYVARKFVVGVSAAMKTAYQPAPRKSSQFSADESELVGMMPTGETKAN